MKTIPLTRGLVALVDDEDYQYLKKYRWYASKFRNKFYARRCIGRNKKMYMHRQIAGDPPGLVVDHSDGNGLNNQKYNLRNCTQQKNTFNRPATGKTSSFKGVSAKGEKWIAQITVDGKTKYLGAFDSEIDAALAYDKEAWKLHGEFALTNFEI